jgi:hypothetical protein
MAEPPPKDLGLPVTPELLRWIASTEDKHRDSAASLIKSRDEYGRMKYGQPLKTEDGRKTAKDAEDELGDMFMYTIKAKINREPLDNVKDKMWLYMKLLYMDEDCEFLQEIRSRIK